MSSVTRRQALLYGLAAATGAVIHFGGVAALLGAGPAQAAPGKPETTSVELGFISLTDAAPLIIAKEKGFFQKQGMTGVDLKKQTSWAVTRDNLELGGARGGIDGAHILSPMPYLLTTGAITKSKQPVPMF
ncbi:MAG: ABC transporter substrate-binding protein, partial [Cyanobium sp.]